MATVTKVVTVCDICTEEIDTDKQYVDAMAYGRTFHYTCWSVCSGKMLTALLELDDVWIGPQGANYRRRAMNEWSRV